ncbi:MAG: MmcB family DNA repair protein [Alphaproteobacteria bacterium]|nr:MmcB family DNA repair protein [Alphaproteobacteria bacterium]MDP6515304.1 MmcB family DNA repair protein [Alphaproteobacteria bacterium]
METAAGLVRGVVRLLHGLGYSTLTEMRLNSGRRVDVAGLDRRARFAVVEIKTTRADFRADRKWRDYLPHCDQFFFAVPAGFPLSLLPEECGVIVADRYQGEVLRPGPKRPMTGAARRQQTLLFAHIAAHRLDRSLSGPLRS